MALKFQDKLKISYEAKGYIVLNIMKLSANGYPDLLLLKDGKASFVECKTGKDTLKPLQKFRIGELISKGFDAFCIHEQKGIIYP